MKTVFFIMNLICIAALAFYALDGDDWLKENMILTKLDTKQVELLADAIKIAENSEKYPYGIKSIDTGGDEKYARKICINSIVNNYKRWDKKGDFIEFMGRRYCPPSAHSLNTNWVRNVKYHYKGKEIR